MFGSKSLVRVASNFHGTELAPVERRMPDKTVKEYEVPKAFVDYNAQMGVDLADQLRSYYERDLRSKRWWLRLFYALVETNLVNSYVCYNEMIESGAINGVHAELTLLDYKRSVTRGLYWLLPRKVPRRNGDALERRVLSRKRGPKRRKNRFSTPDYVRFSGVGGHKRQEFLSVRAWCKWWAVEKEVRPFSKYTCSGVPLPRPQTQLFQCA